MPTAEPLLVTREERDRVRDMLRALSHVRGGGSISVNYVRGHGLAISTPGARRSVSAGGAARPLREFVIAQEFDAFIKVDNPDFGQSGEPEFLYVAKPWGLRPSSFDNQSFDRNGTSVSYAATGVNTMTASASGEEDENLFITTSYAVGATILAERVGSGITGLTDPNTDPIVWMDLNTEGRNWAREVTA